MSQFESIDGSAFRSEDLQLPDSQIWGKLVVPAAGHTKLVEGFRRSLSSFAKQHSLELVQRPTKTEAAAIHEMKSGFESYVSEALSHDGFASTTKEDPDLISIEFHSEFILRAPNGKVEIALLGTVHNSHNTYIVFDHAQQPVVVPSPAMTILMSGQKSDVLCINPIFSSEAVHYLWGLMQMDLSQGKMKEHASPFLDCIAAAAANKKDDIIGSREQT